MRPPRRGGGDGQQAGEDGEGSGNEGELVAAAGGGQLRHAASDLVITVDGVTCSLSLRASFATSRAREHATRGEHYAVRSALAPILRLLRNVTDIRSP